MNEKMKVGTVSELRTALGKAGWPSPRHIDGGKRSLTKEFTDCGTLVAEETILYKRGKEVSRSILVNTAYLPAV